MKTALVMALLSMTIAWSTGLSAEEFCYSWIDEAYVKGRVKVSYRYHEEYRAAHKVQRWKLKDGTWAKDDDLDVTGIAASTSGGFYWEAVYEGKCRLRNYATKETAVITTRFQSPAQAANADKYTVDMRPSGNSKLQKYTLPGNTKEGEDKEKDNVCTAASAITVTN